MMGQATVGAMIVWDKDGFKKEDYRLYNRLLAKLKIC